jgi:hypothetical protein
MGSENRTALIMQFQLFAVASSDGFLGNVERPYRYDRLNDCNRKLVLKSSVRRRVFPRRFHEAVVLDAIRFRSYASEGLAKSASHDPM